MTGTNSATLPGAGPAILGADGVVAAVDDALNEETQG